MKTTKNILLGLVVILTFLLFFQACEKSNTVDFSGKYVIKVGETKNVPQNTNLATLTFQEYTDSRCPANVQCVWEGAAQGKFKLKTDQSEQIIELCLGGCNVISKNTNQEFNVNGVIYTVKLIELTPYPGTGNANEKAEATILVQKK